MCLSNTAGAASWKQTRGNPIEVIWGTGTLVNSGTQNLLSGKKFSDYAFLLVLHSGHTGAIGGVIPMIDGVFSTWNSNQSIYASSQRNYVMRITQVNDTSFTISLAANHWQAEGVQYLYGVRG